MTQHPALSNDELDQFDAFGFSVRRQTFAAAEVSTFIETLESVCTQLLGSPPGPGAAVWEHYFAETHPTLMKLVSDDRIYEPVSQILGEDFLWVSSEGMWGFQEKLANHHWHADGGWIPEQMSPHRLKVMLYLDPQSRDSGALRIMPGSPRSPYHDALLPCNEVHDKVGMPLFFGMRGEELPGLAIETKPGDLVFFNNWLFHSVYGKVHPRRSIVLQFTAPPTTEAQRNALRNNGDGDRMAVHENLAASDDPRIRKMVERTRRIAESLQSGSRR